MKQYQLQFKLYLTYQFESKKLNNPKYSMRALAQHLDMNSGAVSSILKGSRVLSKEKTLFIMEKMKASQLEIDQVLYSQSEEDSSVFYKKYSDFSHYEIFNERDFKTIFSKDIAIKLLALSETEGFKLEANWIADRLGEAVEEVEQILKSLLEKGYIEPEAVGKKIIDYLQSTDSKASKDIKTYHKKSLVEAARKVDEIGVEHRDLTSAVFACDKESFKEAQELIRSFQEQLMAVMSKGSKNEVYKLNIQLYPVTKLSKKDDK